MRTAVVILNWNGRKFLEKFLPTLLEYSRDEARIIVADNASTDDSVAFVREHFPEAELILNKENGGFAKGYNQALSQVDAEYFVLLNSDIEVTPGWIRPVIDLMDSDRSIAACQPKILSYHEKHKFEYAGAAGGFIDKYGYPFCRGRIFLSIEDDHGQYDDACEVFWATGACMFVRAEVYRELGGLDDDFFAHMEEIDFCWRLHNEGYKVMYCPSSKVYHIGGGTLPKISSRKTYLNFRNNFFLLYKNLPSRRVFPTFAKRLVLDSLAAFKFLVQAGFRDFIAVVKAHFSFYAALPKLRRKRKKLKHGSMKHIYRNNIVFEYYIQDKHKFSQLNKDNFFKE
jgi:GT2 family glycosyltransferase